MATSYLARSLLCPLISPPFQFVKILISVFLIIQGRCHGKGVSWKKLFG